MALTDHGIGRSYKIKLESGRVLGPLDLDRIKKLIKKNRIIGKEMARVHPIGEWVDINKIPEIAALLVSQASPELGKQSDSLLARDSYHPILGKQFGRDELMGETKILEEAQPEKIEAPEIQSNSIQNEDGERTQVFLEDSENIEKTVVDLVRAESIQFDLPPSAESSNESFIKQYIEEPKRSVSHEKTILFQKAPVPIKVILKKGVNHLKEVVAALITATMLGVIGYYLLLDEPPKKIVNRFEPFQPLPLASPQPKPDPNKSNQLYQSAIKDYLADHVQGYRSAAKSLREAITYDPTNAKALALLASCYMNLIDSSNKDENYFDILTNLIEMSRAKNVDLPETVIADVEFYLIVNKGEAAQNRIVEYTKSHSKFGSEMFYYLALTFYSRGDFAQALKYVSLIPETKIFSAKVYYLRGLIAEALNDDISALEEYKKGKKFNSSHAKSRLKIIQLLYKKGILRDDPANKGDQPNIGYLYDHINLLSPQDQAAAYYFHAQFLELNQKQGLALLDMGRAISLDPDNHDYLLEFYTLCPKNVGSTQEDEFADLYSQCPKGGKSSEDIQKMAKMYYYLGEGEKLVKQGKYQDALIPFLEARQQKDDSYLPPLKIGDMFNSLHDIENAKVNYKLAAQRAPNDVRVWTKYIDSLIQSYEWSEAAAALDRFRNLKVGQSAIDKAAADLNQKQERYAEAQRYYKKAMSRKVIDSSVYAAYARSLMSTENYKDAPFFFSLALRFDPLNISIKVDIARCVAETEGINRAISMIQDEMNQHSESRAEYLAAIAEFQIKKGSWDEAKVSIDQAIQMNPDYAYSWKLRAQVYMNQEHIDKTALDKALDSYKSYSERNFSDPSGYLERYKIFIKKAQFEKAKEELDRIFSACPKYPNLHFYLGALYSLEGNHAIAEREFRAELSNNPNSFQSLLHHGKELLELARDRDNFEVNRVQEALGEFKKAMLVKPNSSEAMQEAGWANSILKNYQPAVSLMKNAIELDKQNPLLYKRLGLIYRSMNDLNSACLNFREYLRMEPDATDKSDFASCF